MAIPFIFFLLQHQQNNQSFAANSVSCAGMDSTCLLLIFDSQHLLLHVPQPPSGAITALSTAASHLPLLVFSQSAKEPLGILYRRLSKT